jgi:sugar transferase EpsL
MRYEGAKRVLDVLGGALALACLAPVMACIAVAVLCVMGTPVLFRQMRPGLHGKPFEMIKFRTMRGLANGENMLSTDAARLTPLGRMLRSASLDELPTLFNVLRGDMSLVGPRPLLQQYLDRYTPEQARRHDVRPGITGWAQVGGRNALSWDEKFARDIWYVDHRSLWLDLRILALTVVRVARRDGIGHGSAATMPEFVAPRADQREDRERR